MNPANREVILCPFHRESTPSCCVNHEDNTFQCFGCGKHGDIDKDGNFVWGEDLQEDIG